LYKVNDPILLFLYRNFPLNLNKYVLQTENEQSKCTQFEIQFNYFVKFLQNTYSFLFYSRLFSAKVAAQYAILEDNKMDQYSESVESNEADEAKESAKSTSSEYDSSSEGSSSSSSANSSADEEDAENDANENPEPAVTGLHRVRGAGVIRRGVRCRGGRGRGVTGKAKAPKTKKPNLWKTWNESPFTPVDPVFDQSPGPKIDFSDDIKGFVKMFLTDELIELITSQTNLYARQYTADRANSFRENQWRPVTNEEIVQFIAITILIGIHGLPGLQDYWSNDGLLHNPVFHASMGRNRYQLILKFLHFNDNSRYDPNDPQRDRLYKIRPLLDYLVKRFQEVYYPSREISIDEQLLKFKGQLHFKQYIPNKRSRFGIKLFTLCDKSGYVYNTTVYAGKSTAVDDVNLGKSGAIVLEMMEPLLNKGHQLFIDNWYTSLKLLLNLMTQNTSACGTVRRDRGQFPSSFTKTKLQNRGETIHLTYNKILALRYKDKKDVFFLSTMHRPKLLSVNKRGRDGNPIMKEQLIIDYNNNMGFVDKNDQIVGQHTMVRKSHKWTTKIALRRQFSTPTSSISVLQIRR